MRRSRSPRPFTHWYSIFLDVWATFGNGTILSEFDWIVKLDPDTIFLADRLRAYLGSRELRIAKSIYNSHASSSGRQSAFMKHLWPTVLATSAWPQTPGKYNHIDGPMIVLTKTAVARFVRNIHYCSRLIKVEQLSEDEVLSQCLRVLKVTFHPAPKAGIFCIRDWGCNATAFAQRRCTSSRRAAYHPFKTAGSALECWLSTTAIG